MQIDQLQIELRPRSNAQALDLGFALLRSHAGAAYLAFLALWLPLIGVALALTAWWPQHNWAFMLAAWWFKPILERAPLYVLSRQVFGAAVTWQEAVRAWPRQLGGGALRLLTWARPFAAGRGLYQPMWQLELARGAVARTRMRVLARNGTAQSAFWFGAVCAHLEVVLQFGILGFIGIFVSGPEASNPFAIFTAAGRSADPVLELVIVAAFGVATAIMAPIYTACCFTLYLNRRASLEAWDLELQLRQIRRPVPARARGRATPALALLAAAMLLSLAPADDARAAAPADLSKCTKPAEPALGRGPHHGPEQQQLRRDVDAMFAHDDLRGYTCEATWRLKKDEEKPDEPKLKPFNLSVLAQALKVAFIALLVGLVGSVLYRYRHSFPGFYAAAPARMATEVGGLDIRAESLPDDVTGQVRALWAAGERRTALALLYRATLARMVADNGLQLRQGNTEGDCLRLANEAARRGLLGQGRLDVASAATALWLSGAYGARWPDEQSVAQRCAEWDAQFGIAAERTA
ncbi:MAG: hypothetical protein H7335_16370 [Massilia sp.]|nr:hypothetical protein [Massilia sp.]